ncbi:MAG: BadF/BadG/BcrA/BcrD ATPase family protein [Angelakisella sp.]
MPLFIAADGGGTKTELALFNENGTLLGHRITGGSNPIFMDPEVAYNNITIPIDELLTEQGLSVKELSKISLFIPGARHLADRLRSHYGDTVVETSGDDLSALYGALGNSPGVVVLSGTGSFAIGRRREGAPISVGGWGGLFGDRGSGYHIGLDCLETVAWQCDAGITDTVLAGLVREHFGVDDLARLRSLQQNRELFSRERIAALCRGVAACAETGDTDALAILGRAARSLAELAELCAGRLGLSEPCPCVLLGGVSKVGAAIAHPFAAQLAQLCPTLYPAESCLRPLSGAMLCVLLAEGPVSQTVLENLKQV